MWTNPPTTNKFREPKPPLLGVSQGKISELKEKETGLVPFAGTSAKQIVNKIPALDLEETIRGKKLETGLPSAFPALAKPS